MYQNPKGFLWFLVLVLFFSPTCPNGMGIVDAEEYSQAFMSSPAPDKDRSPFKYIYNPANIDSLQLPSIGDGLKYSLQLQKKLLQIKRRGKKSFNIDGLKFSRNDLERTVELLEDWGATGFVPLSEYFDVYQINGRDKRGSVQFTGYYSPVLDVRSSPDEKYKYPIYTRPKGYSIYPSRAEIYRDSALSGKKLELAYSPSLLDIQSMQLQGSGYVQYEDGSRHLFSYAGSNGHPRKSIERYYQRNYGEEGVGVNMNRIKEYLLEYPEKADEIIFHNPSYVFFNKNAPGKKVNGSGNVPLQPYISIATDKRYIPTGACLFGSRPIPRKNRIDYQINLLLAQDVGGAIKGTGHIDLYTGVGKKGRKGTYLKDDGELWLVLAKKGL